MPPDRFRIASLAELPSVSAFVRGVYAAQVAPTESSSGQATFGAYTDPAAMAARAATHTVWVAEAAGQVVGALELRAGTHVALLFVASAVQRQGVGRGLLIAALGPPEDWPALTVNSTPSAVGAYERLGFDRAGAEQEGAGLRFQPMIRSGPRDSGDSGTPPG